MSYITLTPYFSAATIFKRPKHHLSQIFPHKQLCFLYSGRQALMYGLRFLKIKAGDRLLMPAYICRELPQIIQRLKINIDYYQITKDLKPNFTDLEKRIQPQTKAILIVHYFGFAQPIEKFKALCQKYQVKLIEDCAHSFGSQYQGQLLGNFGDIAFFSLKKVFALPDGALLITPQSANIISLPTSKIRNRAIASFLLSGLTCAIGWVGLNQLRQIKTCSYQTVYQGQNDSQGITKFSQKLWKHIDWQKAGRARKNNYLYLAQLLKHIPQIKILLTHLPQGTVPYALPIIAKDSGIKKKFHQQGILAEPWPVLPAQLKPKEYPTAFYLARKILLLPVHQRLNKNKFKAIARAFNS